MNDFRETTVSIMFFIMAFIIVVGAIALFSSGKIIKQNKENNIVDQNRDYGIILFTASWCKACQEIESEVNCLNENGAGIVIFDVDESPEIAKQNNITVLPAFIVYNNRGEILRTHNIIDIYKIMEKLK